HADGWPGINEVTKYVVSHKPLKLTWENSVQLEGDVVARIKELKGEDGPNLQVHGSASFIQTLLSNDLVDELWLKIFPLTLGKGKHLFAEGAIPAVFKLSQNQVSPGGVIFVNYERAGEVQTGSF
ncbi:MAG: dihydrofolate reductase family protein, partial [Chitinophagaceae bacterium]